MLKQAQQQKSKKQDQKKEIEKVKSTTKIFRNKQLATKSKKINNEEQQGELLEKIPKDYNVQFSFPEPSSLSIPVIQVNDASFWYNPDNILFKDLNFGIDMESRIALVGPNGAGKTTLLKLLSGELQPSSVSYIKK